MRPLRRPIHRISHIRTPTNHKNQYDLDKEPDPAPTWLVPVGVISLALLLPARLPTLVLTLRILLTVVQIPRFDRNDVVVVREFARFGAETQVSHRGDFDGLDVKAQGPLV